MNTLEELAKRVAALERAQGQAGTGECICKRSPAQAMREGYRMIENPRAARGYDLFIDHRCPHHGEKAQPALWGRHKEKELSVTWPVWDSLGIIRTADDEYARKPYDHEAALAAVKARQT